MFKREILATRYCAQYGIITGTKEYDAAVNAFCQGYSFCKDPQAGGEVDVCLNNLSNARKLEAFDWLAANADEISIEWTGTHNHIYSGNEENLERLGCGRSLLEAVENAKEIRP